MPGWKAFVEPIFRSIDPAIVSPNAEVESVEEEIVSLSPRKILVPSLQVAKSLQRLTALVTSHPHPSLTRRLLGPILLPLWSLSSWYQSNDYIDKSYRKPARNLLKTLLQLSSSSSQLPSRPNQQPSNSSNISIIAQNLMFRGRSDPGALTWIYTESSDGGIQIEERAINESNELTAMESDLASIDGATAAFIALIESVSDFDTEISHLFIDLCRKWLKDSEKNRPGSVVLTLLEPTEPTNSAEKRLIEAKIMQRMMTSVPEKLVSDSRQVLDLVNQILSGFNTDEVNDNGDEDIAAIALSLLNIILTSSASLKTPDSEQVLEEIQASLHSISKKTELDISSTAQNLLLLIKFRDTLNDPGNVTPSITKDQQVEDRKSYSLAMSYLTSADSPPPVRVQGLELISALVRSRSSVLDIPALLVLFSSLLQDSDEYIYLRVIKSFIELSDKHPKAILNDLIDRYVDPNEESELDQRLRFGEALLQVIENVSSGFSGEIAKAVCEGLLSIAGRRGYRPKSEQEQEKRNRLRQEKNKEAEDAWDGPVPQLEDDAPESQEDYEILSQIVSGWESKRGSEDVRIRASALSILGTAIEENVAGIGSSLISTAIDLSIHILTLEPEPEKGILRRSAILLIMCFVRALNSAREQGRKLGFGLVGKNLEDVQRILGYVEGTDNDGLVRQHAKDVIDGLQAWQINTLLPSQTGQTELQELAGLSIKPGGRNGSNARIGPRIEEIE